MVELIVSRYTVKMNGKRIGVVVPRNANEWVFVRCESPFAFYVADTPERAVAQCPEVQKYSLIQV